MKILIADDQNEKQESLSGFILENLDGVTIESTYSFRETRNKIITTNFDFILLDMTMPMYVNKNDSQKASEVQKHALAGKDIIQTMNYRDIKIPVIIVTQFDVFGRHDQLTSIDEITAELLTNFSDIVKGYVLWDYQSDSWKKKLLQILSGMKND